MKHRPVDRPDVTECSVCGAQLHNVGDLRAECPGTRPSVRPTYEQDVHHASMAGFSLGTFIRHYSTGDQYRITAYYKITDNSKYDGRLGILYVHMGGLYGRPFAQMIEPHVHQGDYEQAYRFEVVR